MTEFVDAYSKSTGRKHRVPAYFVGHPTLGRDLSKTPRQKAQEKATPTGAATTRKKAAKAPNTPATGENKE